MSVVDDIGTDVVPDDAALVGEPGTVSIVVDIGSLPSCAGCGSDLAATGWSSAEISMLLVAGVFLVIAGTWARKRGRRRAVPDEGRTR